MGISGPDTIYIIRHAEKPSPTKGIKHVPKRGDPHEPPARPIWFPKDFGVAEGARHGSRPPSPPPVTGDPELAGIAFGCDSRGLQVRYWDVDQNLIDPVTASLTPRGWQRAGAIAVLFGRPVAPFQRPGVIFAAGYPAAGDLGDDVDTHSHRPIETVQPLAERLELWSTLRCAHQVGDEEAAMQDVKSCAGVVLVAWEHNHIFVPATATTPAGGLVANLSVTNPPAGGFRAWPNGDFSSVWVFENDPSAATADGAPSYRFSVVDQDVLDRDPYLGV